MSHLLYSIVFTTIHKHPFFMTLSCRTVFRLLAHISLIQYSRSLKVLAFKRTLVHISERYPCISSSWTQWVKNKKPRIEKGFSMAKFSCDDNMGLDLQFIHNNIARVLHDMLNSCYWLEMNGINDFRLLIDVLGDPRAFHE